MPARLCKQPVACLPGRRLYALVGLVALPDQNLVGNIPVGTPACDHSGLGRRIRSQAMIDGKRRQGAPACNDPGLRKIRQDHAVGTAGQADRNMRPVGKRAGGLHQFGKFLRCKGGSRSSAQRHLAWRCSRSTRAFIRGAASGNVPSSRE